MKRHVHILATCRRPELVDMTLLVFGTLRVGFPTSDVTVWLRGTDMARDRITAAANAVGADCRFTTHAKHDDWVSERMWNGTGPCVLLDTDVVLHANMETRLPDAALAGEMQRAHWNPTTGANHVERLHTALLAFNGSKLRDAIYSLSAHLPFTAPGKAPWDPIRQQWHFLAGMCPEFWDTAAGLYQAGIGIPIDEDVEAKFTHLHCGTWSDKAGMAIPTLREMHATAATGNLDWAAVRKQQAEWYAQHPTR